MAFDPDALAEAITAAIKRSGVKKAAIARRVGKSWPTVNSWCTGRHPPSMPDLASIAEVTGVPLSELVRAGMRDSSRAPYAAWKEFLQSPEVAGAERWMIEELGEIRFSSGRSPSVETYRRLLFAMQSIPSD